MVAFLEKKLWFPNPRHYDRYLDDGLLAVGGDMSVDRLVMAYQMGIFPWTDKPLTWWCPDPRGILQLDQIYISRSLARCVRRGIFKCTIDQAFADVIRCCAETPRPGAWITDRFIQSYIQLHQAGYAHSVECWQNDRLVGGIYGVAVNGLFAGESMFYRVSNASKVALLHLVDHLRKQGFQLFDIQMVTPVTESMGAELISRETYLDRLSEASKHTCTWEPNKANSSM